MQDLHIIGTLTEIFKEQQRFQVAVELGYYFLDKPKEYREFLDKTKHIQNQLHMRMIPRIIGKYDSKYCFYSGDQPTIFTVLSQQCNQHS